MKTKHKTHCNLRYNKNHLLRGFFAVLFVSICIYAPKIYFTPLYSEYFLRSLNGPLNDDDPELVKYIRENVIEAPSQKPYELLEILKNFTTRYSSELFYQNFTNTFLTTKQDGFFVEAGAMDGEAMSNTLWLERHRRWSGLLIEPDPSNYVLLKRKNRKSWTAKTCLSIHSYPKLEMLTSDTLIISSHKTGEFSPRAMGTIVQNFSKFGVQEKIPVSYYYRRCYPLSSLLLAINVTKIDLLSLDVQNVEKYIIENFNFYRFDVQVVYMEWSKPQRLLWLKNFMRRKGFVPVANIMWDIIFVKENSDIFKLVEEKWPERTFNIFLDQL